jgi:hypothetical protein
MVKGLVSLVIEASASVCGASYLRGSVTQADSQKLSEAGEWVADRSFNL